MLENLALRTVSLHTASKRASGSDSETGSDKKNAESRFATQGSPDGERMFTGTTGPMGPMLILGRIVKRETPIVSS